MEFTCVYELSHHGIKGQRWGVKNGPPYPLDPSDKSKSEKKAEEKQRRSGFNKKKAIKIGGALVGTALLTAGAIYMAKSGKLDNLVKLGYDRSRIAMDAQGDISFKNRLSFSAKDLNPTDSNDNCKDVSEATLKRYLGVDPNAKAGQNTVIGNFHDFVEARKYNKAGIQDLGGEAGYIAAGQTGQDNERRITNRILRKCKDGDVGTVTIRYNVDKLDLPEGTKRYYKDHPEKTPGHTFNFGLFDGVVELIDNQHEDSQETLRGKLDLIDPTSGIELFQIDERAFQN